MFVILLGYKKAPTQSSFRKVTKTNHGTTVKKSVKLKEIRGNCQFLNKISIFDFLFCRSDLSVADREKLFKYKL